MFLKIDLISTCILFYFFIVVKRLNMSSVHFTNFQVCNTVLLTEVQYWRKPEDLTLAERSDRKAGTAWSHLVRCLVKSIVEWNGAWLGAGHGGGGSPINRHKVSGKPWISPRPLLYHIVHSRSYNVTKQEWKWMSATVSMKVLRI